MSAQDLLSAAYSKSAGKLSTNLKTDRDINQCINKTNITTKAPAKKRKSSKKKIIRSLRCLSQAQKQGAHREKATVFTLKDPFAKKSALSKVYIANSEGETCAFYSAREATQSESSIGGAEWRSG